MEEVIVEIENGAAKISVKGVKGAACKALTADLESKLGSVKKTTTTPEFRQASATAKNANRATQR